MSKTFPETQAQLAFMGKYDDMASTTVIMYEITDTKLNEFIRMECSMIYYSDDTSTKEACVSAPTLKFRSDFNLFEAKSGGTEIIRHIQDFEQLGALLLPAAGIVEGVIQNENAAIMAKFGKSKDK